MIQTQLKRIYQYTSLTLRVRHCDEQFCIFVALLVLQAEVNYLGQFYHPHLVKLLGYCVEDEHRLLVYEFMPRGSLENHLFRSEFVLPIVGLINRNSLYENFVTRDEIVV